MNRNITRAELLAFAFAPILGVATFEIADAVLGWTSNAPREAITLVNMALSSLHQVPSLSLPTYLSLIVAVPLFWLFKRLGRNSPIAVLLLATVLGPVCGVILIALVPFGPGGTSETLRAVVELLPLALPFMAAGFCVGMWFLLLRRWFARRVASSEA